MELENKLDEDFLFYLGFTQNRLSEVKDQSEKEKCQVWLQKLLGESCRGVEKKRDRNIYLSNLILCMQEGQLSDPFKRSPNDVHISDALDVFAPVPAVIEEPNWLEDLVAGDDDAPGAEPPERGGRTYLATRTLPGGAGAFAYLAVNLAEEEPKWLGGGEGAFEAQMVEKFKDMVPPVTEMEKILAKRKDPKERERVLTFYDTVAQNIGDELDGKVGSEQNNTINGLLDQLINDLKAKGEYQKFEQMGARERRPELLVLLHDRVKTRRDKVAKREEILDNLEEQMLPTSFFDTSVQLQDKFILPATMWEQIINKPPSKKNTALLQANYPLMLIEKFMELLSNYKEEIAVRMQKRHENIITQMRKELRKEGEAEKKRLQDAEQACAQALAVLAAVKAARGKQLDIENKMNEKRRVPVSEHSQIYDQMRSALYDTQKSVEEEAERGRHLAAAINSVNEQTEIYMQVNDDSVRKIEETNMVIMRNIKRLRNAIKQYETRLKQLQDMQKAVAEATKGGPQSFYFF